MKHFAVILAGGTGSRMNAGLPKQFLQLEGKPLLYYSIHAFLLSVKDIKIIVVLHPEYMEQGREIADCYFPGNSFQFTAGGATRFHSVQNGLRLIDAADESIIMVHDAARCMIDPAMIRRCIEHASSHGSAIPVIHCHDSIRWSDDEGNRPLDRNRIRIVQTPQVFVSSVLLPAFQTDYADQFTDEATVVEASGITVDLVDGDERNIKITRPLDLEWARFLLNQQHQD